MATKAVGRVGLSFALLVAAAALAAQPLPSPDGAQPARLVRDLHPTGSSSPAELTALGSAVVFRAQSGDCTLCCSLFRSDGTTAGTSAIHGPYECNIPAIGQPGQLTVAGGQMFFVRALAPQSGQGLYRSDGTPPGTTLVASRLSNGELPSHFGDLVASRGLAFWTGSHTTFSSDFQMIGRSDGTSAGTFNVASWYKTLWLYELANFAGEPFFFMKVGYPPTTGVTRQLWKTDGSTAGTILVAQLPPAVGMPATEATVVGSEMFFKMDDAAHGLELWKTDGTQAGTALVGDINPGPATSQVQGLRAVGNRLYFAADDGVNGYELWTSDGTEAGTRMVKDVNPGLASSGAYDLTAVGDRLLFVASDGVHGYELWTSDGTEQGTVMVKDINPGAASSSAWKLREGNGTLFFQSTDGVHGIEPWRSDGTPEGTSMVQDIAPGPASSSPDEFTAAGPQLFFHADDGVYGRELWVMPAPIRRADGDAHGEGRADVLVRRGSGEVEVLQSSGTAFSSGSPWRVGQDPALSLVSYADVDGDGRSDLLSRSTSGEVRAYRSTGSFFDPLPGDGPGGAWTWGWTPAAYDLYFADVTGDGRADLVARVRDSTAAGGWAVGDVWVLPSTGRGFTSAGAQAPWSYGWSHGYDLYFGDVTGDGKADLVGRYYGPTEGLTGDVYVAVSTGNRFAFSGRWTYGFSAGYDLSLGDADGDGRADLLSRYYGPTPGLNGDVYAILSDGTKFAWRGTARWTYGWGSTYELLVRDVTGDGRADLIGRHTINGDVYVAVSDGTALRFEGTWATGLDASVELR